MENLIKHLIYEFDLIHKLVELNYHEIQAQLDKQIKQLKLNLDFS